MNQELEERVLELETRVKALELLIHGGTTPFRSSFAVKLREWADELEEEDLIPARRVDPGDDEA